MTTFYLVRHGQTEWNAAGRIQGRTDVPLNDTGREQAAEAAVSLRDLGIQKVYTSPLSRAFETASIIADALGLDTPEIVEDMIERDYGKAEGLDYAGIQRTFEDGKVHGKESRTEVAARALDALRTLEDPALDTVAVVCHGGVIGSLVRVATNYELPQPGEMIANGSYHVFDLPEGELRLVEFNGRHQLQGA